MSNGISRLSWSWPGTVPVVGGEAFSVSAGSKRFPQRRQTKERSHMLMSFGYSSRLKSEACLKRRPPKATSTRKSIDHTRLLAAMPIAKNRKARASRQLLAINSFCFGGASSCARSELCPPVVAVPAAPTPRPSPPKPTPTELLASLMVDVPSLKTKEKRRTSSLWQVGQVRGMAAEENMEGQLRRSQGGQRVDKKASAVDDPPRCGQGAGDEHSQPDLSEYGCHNFLWGSVWGSVSRCFVRQE
jgi:hypothetical protein